MNSNEFGMYTVVEKTLTTVIKYVEVYATEVKLHQSATFFVSIYDVDRKLVERQYVSISGEEYEQWAADDDVAVQLVLNKLGLALAPADAPTN